MTLLLTMAISKFSDVTSSCWKLSATRSEFADDQSQSRKLLEKKKKYRSLIILLIIAIVISSFKYVCQIEHNTLLFGKEMILCYCASLQNFGNLCNTFTLPTWVVEVLSPYSTIDSNCLLVNFVCKEEQNTITFYVAEFCYTCEKVFEFQASI